jgi:hypothetical protein
MNKCYIKLRGRLGNQLFQIAAAYAYCRDYNLDLKINTENFPYDGESASDPYSRTIFKNFNYEIPLSKECEFTEHNAYKYVKIPDPEKDKDIHLNGYFQSLKYFQNYADDFKNLLYTPSDIDSMNSDRVAFHIRRGDYLTIENAYKICNTKYFNKCFEIFDGYNIDIFSDSPEYISNEFKGYKFNLHRSRPALDDLILLSKYKNIVCSNSSFSWWGSFLGTNKNKIIVPEYWMNGEYSRDIHRDEFIKLRILT